MDHYLAQSSAYRSTWPEPDVTLELLRKALYIFFGVKEERRTTEPEKSTEKKAGKPDAVKQNVVAFAKPIPLDDKRASMSSGLVLTKEESDAWYAAGMPSPFEGWLRGFRNGRRR